MNIALIIFSLTGGFSLSCFSKYFLVTKNGTPWFLAEAKTADTKISTALAAMQKATGAAHAFQVVRDLPYAGADAFSFREPIAVSAQSFLSQLF